MSLETDIVAKYGPLFDGRIWHNSVPEEVTRSELQQPYCIFYQVGGPTRVYADNTLSPNQCARIQFGVWGDRSLDVAIKARELRKAALDSYAPDWMVVLQGEPVSDSDDVLKQHGARLDIKIWYIDPLV